MAAFSEHVPLTKSGAGMAPAGAPAGEVGADERIEVTVTMRPGAEHDTEVVQALMGNRLPSERSHLDLETLESQRQTTAMDLAAVEAFATHYGLDVSHPHPERHTVVLGGRADDMRAAFKVELAMHTIGESVYRVRSSPVHIPTELRDIVTAVVGFDQRPQVIAHIRDAAGVAVAEPFTPIQIADLYAFPAGERGHDQCVAILEFGGGLDTADLDAYFSSLGIDSPTVIPISVDGAPTAAGIDVAADGEVQLDVDVIGAIVPGATAVVYFAPNDARGFVDAVNAAVHNPDHRPCAISISWGMAEEQWSEQTRSELDRAFQDAGLLGITVCAASGDDGSTDNEPQDAPHVDYPASSPWVLGCGGTMLEASGGAIASEIVWDDLGAGGGASGGGISGIYDVPAWQSGANTVPHAGDGRAGRGVPDVAGDACPATGYRVRVDGDDRTIGGTSAVAPLWAALIARLTEALETSIGYLNPLIYDAPGATSMRDITQGGNGDYAAQPGWDACTGLGSPNGQALLEALSPPSGVR